MGRYSLRDGKFTANKVTVTEKIPMQYAIPQTVAVSTSALFTGKDLNANGTTALTNVDLLVQPPYPMQLHLNWNAAGAGSDDDALLIAGEDAKGAAISESLVVTSAAAGNAYTSNAFAKVDTITPSAVHTTTSAGLGYRANIGLPYPITAKEDIISYQYGGAYATTAVDLLTVDSTYDVLTMPVMAGSTCRILYLTTLQ